MTTSIAPLFADAFQTLESVLLSAQDLLQTFCSKSAQGNFTFFPEIQILSSEDLGGDQGAYAAEFDRIYLSLEFLETATEAEIVAVVLEEIGHAIDTLINIAGSGGNKVTIY